eukprot:scaffold61889_cov28-Tisochrysis_lutea.AAC.2
MSWLSALRISWKTSTSGLRALAQSSSSSSSSSDTSWADERRRSAGSETEEVMRLGTMDSRTLDQCCTIWSSSSSSLRSPHCIDEPGESAGGRTAMACRRPRRSSRMKPKTDELRGPSSEWRRRMLEEAVSLIRRANISADSDAESFRCCSAESSLPPLTSNFPPWA